MKNKKLDVAINLRMTKEQYDEMQTLLSLLQENQPDFIREAIDKHMKRSLKAVKGVKQPRKHME